MSTPKLTIGRIVHYTLAERDAAVINRRREIAAGHMDQCRSCADGSQIHVGNEVAAGDVYPMVITRVWGNDPTSAVNGQLFLDGNDTYWVTSTQYGRGERHFVWPEHN